MPGYACKWSYFDFSDCGMRTRWIEFVLHYSYLVYLFAGSAFVQKIGFFMMFALRENLYN